MKAKLVSVLKWTGAIAGITGALIVGARFSFSGWGFVIDVVSSAAWLAAGIIMKERSLVIQSIAYNILNVVGIYRWLL